MKKKHFYTDVILFLFLALGIQTALAESIQVPSQTEFNGTTIATYSGGVYTLIEDVAETLFIEQSELVLDGNGRTITPGSASGVGVDTNGQNGITVKNLTITGFQIGIWIYNSNLPPAEPKVNILENNTISGCSTTGIKLLNTNRTIITGNKILNNDNVTSWGIHLNDSGDTGAYDYSNVITGNTVTNNAGGIWLEGSEYNTVTSNTVTDHSASGIYLSVQSDNNTLTNNTSSSNRDGIKLNNSSSNTLTGNTANSNTIAGILLMGTNGSNLNTVTGNTTSNNVYGIQLTNSSDNILTGNTIDGNTNTGIWLDPSNNNTIKENDISNNVRGLYIENSNDNQIYNNNFIDNIPTQAEVSGGSGNVFNLDPFGGNYWSDWSGSGSYGDDPEEGLIGGVDMSPWENEDGWNDTDGDGLSDDDEAIYGTDPLDPDSDDDGLWDGTEVEMAGGTGCPDPLNPDSDGDTLLDGVEVDMGTSPCNADTDGDGIPDNVDPFPLDPEGTEGYIETELRNDAESILLLDLNLFTGPNNNANKGRRGSLSNRANAAANQVANENYQEAIDILFSILDRVDGVEPPKDWIIESQDKTDLEVEMMLMIDLLGYLL